ncbi:hypothetical protein [Pengzhenrongella sicca]|uniref:Uncharacterized protein n=1 Tax=Pengzhenrongella sicca TaxID=2819238 RepID=A0A8A4ZBY7_9MICO|nr:hypothetical protein [Pengzhenrongella sicca]QTE28519.1 hypothetical protein J4E96_14230 [Pengzhenrongella sicca]
MSFAASIGVPAGVLFPESVVHSGLFGVLAAFVAINTLMYSALAVAKMLPKVYPGSWIGDRGRRAQTRSIHPTPSDQARADSQREAPRREARSR